MKLSRDRIARAAGIAPSSYAAIEVGTLIPRYGQLVVLHNVVYKSYPNSQQQIALAMEHFPKQEEISQPLLELLMKTDGGGYSEEVGRLTDECLSLSYAGRPQEALRLAQDTWEVVHKGASTERFGRVLNPYYGAWLAVALCRGASQCNDLLTALPPLKFALLKWAPDLGSDLRCRINLGIFTVQRRKFGLAGAPLVGALKKAGGRVADSASRSPMTESQLYKWITYVIDRSQFVALAEHLEVRDDSEFREQLAIKRTSFLVDDRYRRTRQNALFRADALAGPDPQDAYDRIQSALSYGCSHGDELYHKLSSVIALERLGRRDEAIHEAETLLIDAQRKGFTLLAQEIERRHFRLMNKYCS